MSGGVIGPAARALLPAMTLDSEQLPTLDELQHWSGRLTHAALWAGSAVVVAVALHWLVLRLARRVTLRAQAPALAMVVARIAVPSRWLAAALALSVADVGDRLLAQLWEPCARLVEPALMGWLFYAMVKCGAEVMIARDAGADLGPADRLAARSRHTRVAILSRSAGMAIIVFTLALMLLAVPGARHLGATLLASASLVGLALGAAAQPALKSLIAGVQIAITEPFRIGDVVVVDGESGRVEDIRLSYAVVRTPDERRLIVPTTRFLDATFQNWTRVGGIAGTVVLPIRPGTPIAPIRVAYLRLLAQCPEWDQRSAALMVAEARVGSVELKLLMSAADPALLAELRLAMRETMLEWLRTEMPAALCSET